MITYYFWLHIIFVIFVNFKKLDIYFFKCLNLNYNNQFKLN
jgi:hypothetical protein